jgi:hypothetical protein
MHTAASYSEQQANMYVVKLPLVYHDHCIPPYEAANP